MSLSASFPAAGAHPVSVRLAAAAAADDRGVLLAPASALITLQPGWRPETRAGQDALAGDFTVRLLTPQQADALPPAGALRLPLPGAVLLPGLVNAHTHLDLTDIGPFEAGRGDFPGFIDHVRKNRSSDDAAIARAVRRGAELSLAGGVVAVGDIAGCPRTGPSATPFRALAETGLAGVSFLEFFGVGDRALAAAERALAVFRELRPRGDLRPGLQPHAPYSVEPAAYEAVLRFAREHGVPVATHLAESPAEREFIAAGAGPHRALLESLGLWTDRMLTVYAQGRTPIEHLAPLLELAGCLLIHGNDASDADLARLARLKGPVAYCPRSSEYFGAERAFGPHRYREMLALGVPVCLGTDSIINLPAEAADERRGGISVLDEARLLFRRDGAPAATLVGMMTTAGAAALGLDTAEFRFGAIGEARRMRGVISVETGAPIGQQDPLSAVLGGSAPARFLFLRNPSGLTAKP